MATCTIYPAISFSIPLQKKSFVFVLNKIVIYLQNINRQVMKKTPIDFRFVLIISLFTIGCVSKKKFNEMAIQRDQAEMEVEQLKRRVQQQEETTLDLRQQLSVLDETRQALSAVRAQLSHTDLELEDCRKRQDELLEQNKRILSTASGEKEALVQELSQKELDLEEKRADLKAMEFTLMERERKLQELTDKIKEQDRQMSAIRERIAQAMLGFSATDLSVVQKNGRVYVTLSQNLLFPKGSRAIDKNGVQALIKLAGVLKQQPDLQINVEGHTDPDGSETLNWDLSVQRATSIVQILSENGVNPDRITASGRAFFDPVAPNDTEANKSRNRRTEIILSPKLEEVMSIIRS
jgi:chemotaxis protein MotB